MVTKAESKYVGHTTQPLSGQMKKAAPRRYVSNVVVPEIWRDQLELIFEFLYRQPDYEQLCLEIAYVLKTKLKEEDIEYSSISYRAKNLDSFLGKLQRKAYQDPFREITDFAGVRIVCLYISDIDRIETILNREFKVIEKVDKRSGDAKERFGYNAVHFLVKLGKEFSGARYDHLKNLVCEVQVRTILQHAWATIDEHMVYKKRSQVPEEMRQQIYTISEILEDADKQFEKIRQHRVEYIKKLQKAKFKKTFLRKELNLDSFKVFVERSFPDAVNEEDLRDFDRVLKWIDGNKYKTAGDLQRVVEQASGLLATVIDKLELMLLNRGMKIKPWSNLEMFHISMAILDSGYRDRAGISDGFKNILKEIDDLRE